MGGRTGSDPELTYARTLCVPSSTVQRPSEPSGPPLTTWVRLSPGARGSVMLSDQPMSTAFGVSTSTVNNTSRIVSGGVAVFADVLDGDRERHPLPDHRAAPARRCRWRSDPGPTVAVAVVEAEAAQAASNATAATTNAAHFSPRIRRIPAPHPRRPAEIQHCTLRGASSSTCPLRTCASCGRAPPAGQLRRHMMGRPSG